MEVSLAGLPVASQILMMGGLVLLTFLAFIGKRMLTGMDRMATSVEDLNKNMAVVLSQNEAFERRISHLESRAERRKS